MYGDDSARVIQSPKVAFLPVVTLKNIVEELLAWDVLLSMIRGNDESNNANIFCQAKLEKVLGCTAISRASLSVDENKGIIAYPAGSTVVLHNPKTNAQAHLIGTTKNSVTCLSFSKCGRFLVTGEYGHDPKVRVWEIYDQNAQFSPEKVAELKLHKFGVVCVRFTYDGNKVISVGNEYDKTIAVSDWRKQTVVLENRLTSRVNALDISEQGNYYVTVGVRHVKFWYVTKKATSSGVVPLQGRSAILAEQRNNTFVDVCCASNNRTFSITETNLLVEFRDKKLTGTYDLHGEMPRSLVLGGNEIFIGFNNGTIRCLDVDSMGHKFSYCKPHFLKCDVSKGTKNEVFLPGSHPPGCRYPDVRALCYNKSMGVLTAIYSDRSIYNWQRLDNGNRLTKLSSQLFHVGAIYGVETYPPTFPWLPPGSFISVGADDTIRIWNIDHRTKHFQSDACLPPLQTNVYSEELKKILFVSESVNSLVENSEDVLGASLNDSTTGLRTLRLSPDGRHLAVGGKDGNIYVFDLTVDGMPQIVSHEAHENDVTCLEYSDPTSARYLLASGGRDRLVHLFDPADNYTPLATVDDHTSALNSIVFYPSPDGLELITCAADRLLVVRKLEESADDSVCFFRVNQISAPFGLNNVTMVGSNIIAACQDRQLRSYSLNGKLVKQVKGGISDEGQLTRLKLDPSKTVAATVSTDRSVYVVDAASGECGAVLLGQSDPVTDVAFTLDCRFVLL
uniref:WD_REPEATS_REGION domain-containing protein n=1 Tax=Syphacia muris TaxID=451379 RepID=A0A0N5ABQ9_9BILA